MVQGLAIYCLLPFALAASRENFCFLRRRFRFEGEGDEAFEIGLARLDGGWQPGQGSISMLTRGRGLGLALPGLVELSKMSPSELW